ncbi:MAG: single-stranded DNA-binding protein [Candidatus Staskawiczbacteria bacterium RIFCSPHIGHO2_02_FULL_34_9]|uniref:Single-stranded DNA-binding protein n=1 Tax=Candidatus Staskawiczbacteria bacterium RIFCSPHIGHO2_02_FULL_34_9 TaxID=1802206 RepID=A0A1G2HWQ5_9BACT|nr:MAG: single-stranded DNA-binding protein [Candidatus Staskawiczbacteria bacterium RIFCSPHIGHO2_02_FULL_34_9]
MNLNKAFVLGNVTKDPEVRALPSGQQVTSFSIATNRFYTDQSGQKKQEAEFHNIVCFGKLADISSRYLTKGSLVLIEGRIKTRSWQNSAGVKQYRTEIIAETMQLGPRGSGQSGQSSQQGGSFERTQDNNKDIPIIEENCTPPSNDSEIDVKDIPF